jgi:amino acid transporter
VAFTVYQPAYETLTATASVLLYLAYVLPGAIGAVVRGRRWRRDGPWGLGVWYRPLAALGVLGCGVLVYIATRPPNESTLVVVAAVAGLLLAGWFGWGLWRFPGPPPALLAWEAGGKVDSRDDAPPASTVTR